MRRQKEDMQVNVAGLRRNIKNLAHNYSDAQVKVREATSNDPWGPSSTLMSEIADLTYNVVAFTEIMQMIWKRLNDHGRNWRHVYKALVLLEYLIKTGTEKVSAAVSQWALLTVWLGLYVVNSLSVTDSHSYCVLSVHWQPKDKHKLTYETLCILWILSHWQCLT